MASTEFSIDIATKGGAGAESAAAAVARLADSLTASQSAAAKAAESVKAGELAYSEAEKSANKAALAVEKIGASADAQRGKLEKALALGDTSGAEKAAQKLANLTARQGEAAAKAASTSAAMNAQASALDALKSAASDAATAESKVAKSLEHAKTSAAAAAKAQAAVGGSGKVNEMAEAMGKLGGPLGMIGQKGLGAVEGFKKLGASMGAAGPYVAIAVALVTVAAGVAVAGVAAAGAAAHVLYWAIGLADAARTAKAGGVAADSLTSSYARLQKSATKMFSGLNIERLLSRFSQLVDIFDEGSASANAIKSVFGSFFQPLVDGVANIIPTIILAFLDFEIAVLKTLIAIKPFGSYIVMAVEVVGALALVVGVTLTAALGAVVFSVGMLAVGFTLLTGIVVGATVAVALAAKACVDVGVDMVKGLVDGIMNAGPRVVAAMKNVVGNAVDAAKSLLQINSPSKVFHAIGESTGEGMVDGVDASSASVSGAMEDMVAPPTKKAYGAQETQAASPKDGSSTSVSTTAGAVYHITIEGGNGSPESIADALRGLLHELGVQAGTAVPT